MTLVQRYLILELIRRTSGWIKDTGRHNDNSDIICIHGDQYYLLFGDRIYSFQSTPGLSRLILYVGPDRNYLGYAYSAYNTLPQGRYYTHFPLVWRPLLLGT